MIEFDSLCYLQNHKTGCTFVEAFLRRFCTEEIRRYQKHSPIKKARSGVFYFMNVREPLDAYSSLFRYGLDGKGEVFFRLKAAGQGQLYAQGLDGFATWLNYVLDIRNLRIVMPETPPELSAMLGLKSWRFLRLAAPGLSLAAPSLTSVDQIREFAEQNTVVNRVIRYERMTDELREIVHGPLAHAFADRDALTKWIDNAPRINASETPGSALRLAIPSDLMARLHDREWFLYEAFYGVQLNRTKLLKAEPDGQQPGENRTHDNGTLGEGRSLQ